MRIRQLVLALLLLAPAQVSAEWQLKPFFGVTFGGATTLIDLDRAAGSVKIAFGINGALLGDIFGVEADFGRTPGFFQTGDLPPDTDPLVVQSSATTLTGNVVVALPRRLTEHTLRPYFVGGAGIMRVRIDDFSDALPVASDLLAIDIGGGVTGFLTKRIGLSWDVRYFRSIRGRDEGIGISLGPEQLSFWRANMALAIRY